MLYNIGTISHRLTMQATSNTKIQTDKLNPSGTILDYLSNNPLHISILIPMLIMWWLHYLLLY